MFIFLINMFCFCLFVMFCYVCESMYLLGLVLRLVIVYIIVVFLFGCEVRVVRVFVYLWKIFVSLMLGYMRVN